MARYIDAEKVENTKTMIYGLLQEFIDEYRIYSTSSIDYHGGRADGVETARTMVMRRLNTLLEQPTADVVEVKHGVWEDLYNSRYDNPLYVCSKCNCRALLTNEKDELGHIKCSQELSPYCPHCGAKMDGERRDA